MRMRSPLLLALMLAGCQQYDPPYIAGMGDRERASERALLRYFTCMGPFVKIAKTGRPLSEEQIASFGYRCRPELEDAARKREIYFSEELKVRDRDLWAPTQAQRIRLHEKELAGAFWCDFRRCLTM